MTIYPSNISYKLLIINKIIVKSLFFADNRITSVRKRSTNQRINGSKRMEFEENDEKIKRKKFTIYFFNSFLRKIWIITPHENEFVRNGYILSQE